MTMCGVKTENMALNVCRDEAEFWRTLAKSFKAKSRHVDVGGSRQDWDELQAAYDEALARFR